MFVGPHFFRPNLLTLRAGPTGSVLRAMLAEGAGGVTDTSTRLTLPAGQLGYAVFTPTQTANWAASNPTSTARNRGWRQDAWDLHPAQEAHATTLQAGIFGVTVILNHITTGAVAIVATLTAQLFAVSATNVARRLARVDLADCNITAVPAAFSLNLEMAAAQLNAGELLQIEIHMNPTTNPNAAAVTVQMSIGPTNIGVLVTRPHAVYPEMIARFAAPLAETVTAADSLSRRTSQPRATSDTAPAADSLGRQGGVFRRLTEDVGGAVDSLTRMAGFPRQTADAAPAADGIQRTLSTPRTLSDDAGAVDAAERRYEGSRATHDDAAAADDVQRTHTYVRATEDNIGPTAGGPTYILRPDGEADAAAADPELADAGAQADEVQADTAHDEASASADDGRAYAVVEIEEVAAHVWP